MHIQSTACLLTGFLVLGLGLGTGTGCSERSAPPAIEKAPPPTKPAWRPGYVRPPVIDMHTHLHGKVLPRLKKVMSDNGLATVVNLSGGGSARGVNQSVALSQAFPRIINFYSPIWRDRRRPGFGTRAAKRLEMVVKKWGYRGLKISKALGLYLKDGSGQRIPVDWPELDPLWRKAGALGVPVAIHTGDPKAFWEPLTPKNERYEELNLHPNWSFAGGVYPSREALLAERDRVIARHPKTTFICVHFGNNPEDLDAVGRLLTTYPNVMIDTAARLGEIGRHPPEQVRAFFIRHRKRILFGTDIGLSPVGIMLGSQGAEPPTVKDIKPFYEAHWRFFEGRARGIAHPTPIQGRWTIDAIALPNDVLDDIYWKNAARLLKLKATTRP